MADAEVPADAQATAEPRSMVAITGNIIRDERPPGPDGKTLHGTRLFRPGAKVYLATLHRSWPVAPDLGDPPSDASDPSAWRARQLKEYGRDPVIILAQHRKSRRWLKCWVQSHLITDWRLQLCFQPGVLHALDRTWQGSDVGLQDYRLPDSGRDDPGEIRRFMAIAANCCARNSVAAVIRQPFPINDCCDITVAGPDMDGERALAWLTTKSSEIFPDPFGGDGTYVARHAGRLHHVAIHAGVDSVIICLETPFACWASMDAFAIEAAAALGGRVTFRKFNSVTGSSLRFEVVDGTVVLTSMT